MDQLYIDALKALAEPNRLKLYWLLVHIDERICVAEAMDVTAESQYNVSRNLKMLHKAGLITPQKQGKWVFYTLQVQPNESLSLLVDSVRKLPADVFCDEISRCQLRLSMREGGECVVGANSEEWQQLLRTASAV